MKEDDAGKMSNEDLEIKSPKIHAISKEVDEVSNQAIKELQRKIREQESRHATTELSEETGLRRSTSEKVIRIGDLDSDEHERKIRRNIPKTKVEMVEKEVTSEVKERIEERRRPLNSLEPEISSRKAKRVVSTSKTRRSSSKFISQLPKEEKFDPSYHQDEEDGKDILKSDSKLLNNPISHANPRSLTDISRFVDDMKPTFPKLTNLAQGLHIARRNSCCCCCCCCRSSIMNRTPRAIVHMSHHTLPGVDIAPDLPITSKSEPSLNRSETLSSNSSDEEEEDSTGEETENNTLFDMKFEDEGTDEDPDYYPSKAEAHREKKRRELLLQAQIQKEEMQKLEKALKSLHHRLFDIQRAEEYALSSKKPI